MEKSFAKNIRLKRSREFAGISQEDFALKAGVSQGYISQVEVSKGFSFKRAQKFAEILGISSKWLYYGEGKQFPDEGQVNEDQKETAWLINSGPAKYSLTGDFEAGIIHCKSLTDKHPDFDISLDEVFRVFTAIKGIK